MRSRRLVRAAAVALAVVALVALLSAVPAAVAVSWMRPVPGAVTRGFVYGRDPFAPRQHRGADFAAAPGARVLAACGGVVVNTRGVGARAVTLECGRWRVTHLPLASVAVRTGTHVHAGALLGTLAPSADHRGLHLGVRRAGDPFGYVDPLPFLPGAHHAPPAVPRVGPGARRRSAPQDRAAPRVVPVPRAAPVPHAAPAPRLAPAPRAAPAPRLAPAPRAAPAPHGAPASRRAAARLAPAPRATPVPRAAPAPAPPVAPWPAWAGLALVLCGALGGGVRWRTRRRRAPRAAVEATR